MYQALYRKWRPRTFDDVVGQAHITETLKRQVETGRLSHAYLFAGTRGTGKTTAAKVLSRAVNCMDSHNGEPCNKCPACLGIENGSILDVLELDAASNNGVDHVRALRDEAIYSPAAVKKRVYIVDEVHMLSTAAFNALLKILEEPPEHLMFILATTELYKVPPTILSRCQRFFFKRILPEDIANRLIYVAGQESIALAEEAAQLLSRLADGSMRDALSLLDQCAAAETQVDLDRVRAALGLAGNLETIRLMKAAGRGDGVEALTILSELYAAGKGMDSILEELSDFARDLMILSTAPKGGIPLLSGAFDPESMREVTSLFSKERLMQALILLQGALSSLPYGGNQRTAAELCLLRLCDPSLDGGTAGILARVEALEGKIINGGAPAAAERKAPPVEALATAYEAPPRAETKTQPEQTAPVQKEKPPRTEEKNASPKAQPAGTGGLPADFWEKLLREAKGTLDMGSYIYLSSPERTSWRWENNSLILLADSSLTKNVLANSSALEAIRAAAGRVLGNAANVQVRERGAQPAKNPEQDKFQNLLAVSRQLDITIE